ncbi:MAG: CYTH domain-containing protein [Candidatus Moranbacteria bacterium]|jgi:adenylate cyclase class 2|nr:CYTH domain-containing protein [Candidatus Moranbacteria bacterium]
MNIEYEATFAAVEKDVIRKKLLEAGAVLVRPEFLQKRVVFRMPVGHEIPGGWVRVRDEGDKITMSLKVIDGSHIENQKEIFLTVSNFEEAIHFLLALGCTEKSYQETRHEIWTLDDTEVTIDERPFLEPFVEIEGQSEDLVRSVSLKLGSDYTQAIFGAVDVLYIGQYPHLTAERINNQTPLIVFLGENPLCHYLIGSRSKEAF